MVLNLYSCLPEIMITDLLLEVDDEIGLTKTVIIRRQMACADFLATLFPTSARPNRATVTFPTQKISCVGKSRTWAKLAPCQRTVIS